MRTDAPHAIEARETIITEVDGQLYDRIDRLAGLVEDLERRLSPVLVPTGGALAVPISPSGPDAPLSPVRASVGVIVVRLRALSDQLSTILDRLDL